MRSHHWCLKRCRFQTGLLKAASLVMMGIYTYRPEMFPFVGRSEGKVLMVFLLLCALGANGKCCQFPLCCSKAPCGQWSPYRTDESVHWVTPPECSPGALPWISNSRAPVRRTPPAPSSVEEWSRTLDLHVDYILGPVITSVSHSQWPDLHVVHVHIDNPIASFTILSFLRDLISVCVPMKPICPNPNWKHLECGFIWKQDCYRYKLNEVIRWGLIHCDL